MTSTPLKGAAPLELVLAGRAGLFRGRIAHDLTSRILGIARSAFMLDRVAVHSECLGDRLLAETCLSGVAISRAWLALRPGAGDDAMREALDHLWQPLRRTEAVWRDPGIWDTAGVHVAGRAVMHDAVALYLHMLGHLEASRILTQTLWAYARVGGAHTEALVLRASGMELLDTGEDGELFFTLDAEDPLSLPEIHARAHLRSEAAAAAAPARETHAEAIDNDRAGVNREEAPTPEPESRAPRAPGVVLIPRLGGGEKGTSNKEVQAEYKAHIGQPFPLYPFPIDRRALVEEAAAQAPHARGFFEDLVALQDTREHWAIPPFVAIGEPGGGKTTAIDAFFRRCGVHVERYACDGSQDATASGTPRRWSSGEISLPLRACLTAGHANPVVLWDEISRAGGHTRGSGGTLRDALTSLLEPVNASRYRDPYLEAEVDISHVMHAATANGTDGIANQVLDRLRVLRFPLPGPEHLPVLARRMALNIVRRQGLPDDHGELDRSDLRALAEYWPGGSLRALARLVEVAVRARLTAPFETRH